MSAGPLPGRWLRCPRKSEGLIAGRFVAFKTPLDDKFDDQIPLCYRFTPGMLFKSLSKANVKLGLWINLTRTDRFYDQALVEKSDCNFVKIPCHGHEGAPTVEQTDTFVKLCDRFVSMHPLLSIGVHCTHGFNRTGFMIVAYLVEACNCSVDGAIRQFASQRPPGIYKAEYIQELYRRYADDEDSIVQAPALPDWCFEEQTHDDGSDSVQPHQPHQMQKNNHNQRGIKRKRPSKYKDNAVFMEGVPGVELVTNYTVINRVHQSMKEYTNCSHNDFPGSQPVSMTRKNIELLAQNPYKVSWKADGTRYMMLIAGEDEIYFIDRDNSVFKANGVKFFNRKTNAHLCGTVLDGEMVIDLAGEAKFPRYLVYDIVCFERNPIGEQLFTIRLRAIEVEIINPRVLAMKEGRIVREREPFSVRAKQFFDVHMAEYLLSEKFAKKLTHEPDGLVFQPVRDPYQCGTTKAVLKWKPESLNSIDFKLEVRKEDRTGYANQYVGILYTTDGYKFVRFGELDKVTKAIRELDGKIVECKFENNKWKFMRERTDKSFPNHHRTAESVMYSIRYPVTKDMLLQFLFRCREQMPPPQLTL